MTRPLSKVETRVMVACLTPLGSHYSDDEASKNTQICTAHAKSYSAIEFAIQTCGFSDWSNFSIISKTNENTRLYFFSCWNALISWLKRNILNANRTTRTSYDISLRTLFSANNNEEDPLLFSVYSGTTNDLTTLHCYFVLPINCLSVFRRITDRTSFAMKKCSKNE